VFPVWPIVDYSVTDGQAQLGLSLRSNLPALVGVDEMMTIVRIPKPGSPRCAQVVSFQSPLQLEATPI